MFAAGWCRFKLVERCHPSLKATTIHEWSEVGQFKRSVPCLRTTSRVKTFASLKCFRLEKWSRRATLCTELFAAKHLLWESLWHARTWCGRCWHWSCCRQLQLWFGINLWFVLVSVWWLHFSHQSDGFVLLGTLCAEPRSGIQALFRKDSRISVKQIHRSGKLMMSSEWCSWSLCLNTAAKIARASCKKNITNISCMKPAWPDFQQKHSVRTGVDSSQYVSELRSRKQNTQNGTPCGACISDFGVEDQHVMIKNHVCNGTVARDGRWWKGLKWKGRQWKSQWKHLFGSIQRSMGRVCCLQCPRSKTSKWRCACDALQWFTRRSSSQHQSSRFTGLVWWFAGDGQWPFVAREAFGYTENTWVSLCRLRRPRWGRSRPGLCGTLSHGDPRGS